MEEKKRTFSWMQQEAEFKVSRSRVERVVSRKVEGLFLTGGGFNGKVSQEED